VGGIAGLGRNAAETCEWACETNGGSRSGSAPAVAACLTFADHCAKARSDTLRRGKAHARAVGSRRREQWHAVANRASRRTLGRCVREQKAATWGGILSCSESLAHDPLSTTLLSRSESRCMPPRSTMTHTPPRTYHSTYRGGRSGKRTDVLSRANASGHRTSTLVIRGPRTLPGPRRSGLARRTLVLGPSHLICGNVRGRADL
jgi:hypothetical protein